MGFKKGLTVIRSVMGENELREIHSVRRGVVYLYDDSGSDADNITYDLDGREIGGRGMSRIRFNDNKNDNERKV